MSVDAAIDVNWFAVLAGVVGYQALGFLWYGPLFGSRWMVAMGYDGPEDVGGESPTAGYVMTTVGAFVAVVALAVVVDWVGATTWPAGLAVGLVTGVGFVATTSLQSVPFEGQPWPVYLLNVGYNVVALAGLGALLAGS